jgi:L-asparagine oxygenase
MDTVSLSADENAALRDSLLEVGSPYDDLEQFLLFIYPVFARLPSRILERLFRYRNSPSEYGALQLENFPIDAELPPTPTDGKRSTRKRTYISEASILGVAQILGQPLGYRAEKDGDVVQVLAPVKSEARATSSESSEVDLGFHTDFNFDEENPEQPYNVTNADYIVLLCLRQDPNAEARTSYAAAGDICRRLPAHELRILREPLFQFAASYSFAGGSEDRIWSEASPIIKGPTASPEISVDMLCGVRGTEEEAEGALQVLRDVCAQPGVSTGVCLKPGDIFLMDNRKGAHARTAFRATFDGNDRWCQRVYVRRSLWELRNGSTESLRVF